MGILYVVAAFGIVPALLFVFHRLSRVPPTPGSVADEAERWLRSRT